MDFKYIKNIVEEEATILLYDQIGDSVDENGNYVYGISGSSFAYEMQYLQDKCKKINVRINSIGGNVLDGYSIVSAILNSKIKCDTYIDGLAASISGVIAMAGEKCYMADYGTMMLHNPSGGNDDSVLALVKSTLVTILSKRTKLDEDTINKMMDAETYLSATECIEMGLVDVIVKSDKKMKMSTNSLTEMAFIYNKLINKKPKMEKITNMLNLSNEATEVEIVAAIEDKDTKNAELLSENETLKARLKEIEDAELAKVEAEAKELETKSIELVENAIKAKKIEESAKDETIKLAIANFGAVENMLSKINNVKDAVKIFDAKNIENKDTRADWTIRDWEKKDVKGLEVIKNETPAIYTEMYNKFYNKK